MILNKKELAKVEIYSVTDFEKVVKLVKMEMTNKTCVLLNGELAAGKTTFVQMFCESVLLQNVTSPTFSLHQVYKNSHISIDHFDLYRLNSDDDVETSGLWDVLAKEKGIVFIEWPSRISLLDIPLSWKLIEVHIDLLAQGKRETTISCYN